MLDMRVKGVAQRKGTVERSIRIGENGSRVGLRMMATAPEGGLQMGRITKAWALSCVLLIVMSLLLDLVPAASLPEDFDHTERTHSVRARVADYDHVNRRNGSQRGDVSRRSHRLRRDRQARRL